MTFLLRYWPHIAAAAALVALGLWLGGLGPKAELAREQIVQAQKEADWQAQSRQAAERALKKQQTLQLAADAARGDLEDAIAKIKEQDARIARISVDSDRMRRDLARYASGAGSSDSVTACQTRAGALADLLAEGGGLLGTCAGLFRESAIAHDERAAEVTALLKAWPNHAETRQP